jgi:hypothetical protein
MIRLDDDTAYRMLDGEQKRRWRRIGSNIQHYIRDFDFKRLFVDELGWDNLHEQPDFYPATERDEQLDNLQADNHPCQVHEQEEPQIICSLGLFEGERGKRPSEVRYDSNMAT